MIRELKLVLFVAVCFLCVSAFSQEENSLETADSLFLTKKYTEAFEIYEEQFDEGVVTSAMLLKMAFISEGLRDHVSALYYLNKYYLLTADRSVLYKMEELAEDNGLAGYEVGDRDFLQTNLLRFQDELLLFLTLVSLLLLISSIRSKRKDHMPIGLPIVQILVLGAMMFVVNEWYKPNQAIIEQRAIIMSGPSAAAEPLEVAQPGHRLELVSESDVWIKIIWDDEEAYVRKSKLLRL